MIQSVSSRTNPRIKLAASLNKSSQCRKRNTYLLEGPRFINDLLKRNDLLEFIVLSEQATAVCREAAVKAAKAGIQVLEVPVEIFSDVSSTEHSQGIAAVCTIPEFTAEDVFNGRTVLALDGVSDPGNAGTAVRSAAAFGCSGVVFLPGSAFPWNPKVTRSSAGLVSSIPIIEMGSLIEAKTVFSEYLFLGASAAGEDISLEKNERPVCILIGSEAHGLSSDSLAVADRLVSIPMEARVESLNAGVSASLVLYSLFRRTF